MRRGHVFASAAIAAMSCALLFATALPAAAATPELAPTALATVTAVVATSAPVVTSVTGDLALGGQITVGISDPSGIIVGSGWDARNFVLYLGNRRIDGIIPQVVSVGATATTLMFDIQRTDDSKEAWSHLLGSPPLGDIRKVPVSVGYASQAPIESKVPPYHLGIIGRGLRVVAGFLAIGFLLLILWFFRIGAPRTALIRDPSDLPPVERAYSLGRTQMAVWFFVVLLSYVGIWLITGVLPTLSDSALALIGISAGTALGAAAVDMGKNQAVESDPLKKRIRDASRLALAENTVMRDGLRTQLDAPVKGGPDPNVIAEQLQVAEADRRQLAAGSGYRKSEGFFADILSDANGYSFHRLQMVVWTVVLVFIFGGIVYRTLAMPEFGASLLALMGISGGTYIGFKFPEAQPGQTGK